MRDERRGFEVAPFLASRRQMIDWLSLVHRQHTIHALLEVDVTGSRQAIREQRSRTGEAVSFTGFIVACLARAIDEDKWVHAYRKGRKHVILFDDVDATVMVESDVDGAKLPVPCVVRAANRKTPAVITREIRAAQTTADSYAAARRWLPVWLLAPAVLRRFLWARLLADPSRRKRIAGTTAVTAVGMYGSGIGWAIPLTAYPLCLSLGGIARKPVVVSADDDPGSRQGQLPRPL